MNKYLIQHAIDNVWCNPDQDLQHIFKAQRISNKHGVKDSIDLFWNTLYMPTRGTDYHVYQIGNISPGLLGLMACKCKWVALSDVAMDGLVIAQIYTTQGLLFPLSETYITVTKSNAVVLAVREQNRITDITTKTLYFRFYSNAFFSSFRSYEEPEVIKVRFLRYDTLQNALIFQYAYKQYLNKPGYCTLTLNGEIVDDFVSPLLEIGDVLEFVYDSTVKKVVDFPISTLTSFQSDKDGMMKYLLHYDSVQGEAAGTDAFDKTIDFKDDCDVYILRPSDLNKGLEHFKGTYYNKNNLASLRQLTHRDYSISAPYIASYIGSKDNWSNIEDLYVRVLIRDAGYNRQLINDSHRIKELYKLPNYDLGRALLGVDSNVVKWQAASLEQSAYVDIMGARSGTITIDMIEDGYGYNSIAKIIGDSPIKMDHAWVSLPPGLWANSTIFEYDKDGLLLGWYIHSLGKEYSPVYNGCKLIEGRVGKGGFRCPEFREQQDLPISDDISYHFYIADKSTTGINNSTWQDVTGDTSKYEIVGGKCHWFVNSIDYMTCIKSDQSFLLYQHDMKPDNGLLQFSIRGRVDYGTSIEEEVLHIPAGALEVWLNGHALIEDIDYFVTWPEIVIINKEFLNEGLEQSIMVSASGFCNSDMSRPQSRDHGFIKWGVMSYNDTFNLRDDKVTRIVSNGRVFHSSSVEFSEDGQTAALPGVVNGSPYSVKDVVVPLRDFTQEDTYNLLEISIATDKAISDYLTLKLPEEEPEELDVITSKYNVYSPFTSTIIHDLVNGRLPIDNFKGQYSDKDVKDHLVNYVSLLEYDPSLRGVDTRYLAIHPHNLQTVIEMSIYQYNFVARANHIYLNDAVDLSAFISIIWY